MGSANTSIVKSSICHDFRFVNIAQIKQFPPVSASTLKLVGLLDRPDIRNEDIVTTMKYDGVLTGNALRLCNSPLTGLRIQVSSVDQAESRPRAKKVLIMTRCKAESGQRGGGADRDTCGVGVVLPCGILFNLG